MNSGFVHTINPVLVRWLMILFTWASTLAMIVSAVSGERGFGFSDSKTNNFVHILYGLGVIGVFPACLVFIVGLLRALWMQL